MLVSAGDFIEVKSVLSILGYLTQSSIASIMVRKEASALENEYMKLRSNTKKFESSCARFPCLEKIDCFSTGFVTILTQIVNHLAPKNKIYDDEKVLLEKILVQTKKVTIRVCGIVN